MEYKILGKDGMTDARTEGIVYKRRKDLENEYVSTIWVEVFVSKKVSILMCSFYRQWCLPNHCNILNSGSQNLQRDRYILYSKQLEKAHS